MHHMPRIVTVAAFLLAFAPALRVHAEPAVTIKDFEEIVYINSCNGDIIPLNLTTHAVIHPNKNGTTDIQVTIVGSGTALSGTEYVVHQHNKLEVGGTDPEFEIDALLVSKGDEPNEHVTIRLNPETGVVETESKCIG